MSANNNHIDNLIKQKLDAHKVKAPENAWNRLNADLQAPARTRFFWIVRSAAAAVLLLVAFGAGYYFSEFNRFDDANLAENIPQEQNVKEAGQTAIDESQLINTPAGKATDDLPLELADHDPTANSFTASLSVGQSDFSETQNVSVEEEKPVIIEPEGIIAESTDETGSDEAEIFAPSAITNTEEAIAQQQGEIQSDESNEVHVEIALPKDEVPVMSDEMLREMLLAGQADFADGILDELDTKRKSKWSIGGKVSPVYSYRTLSGASVEIPDETVDAGFFNSNEEGITTLAGGISLDFAFNKRLSLGSGMYFSRIGQQNNEVLAFNDPESSGMYKLTSSSGSVTVNAGQIETAIIQQPASPKDSIFGDYSVSGSFVQNLDYLEVPLVLKYKVVDRKFSLNLLGGLSPGILLNNRSYLTVEGQKLQTGTTENIEQFIYNSVVGLGLEYAISRKVAFSMEPSFKYSLSPVNSGSDLRYHPYSLSVFTGISYRLD